ncbi:MAG: helix-turn-helix domain-containing protein [Planctomycetota bacterium]
MTTFAAAFKDEIRRLARKEIKEQTEAMRKQVTGYRAQIAAMKREMADQQRQIKALEKAVAKGDGSLVGNGEAEEAGQQIRFSPAGFASHRERLGLSAADMGRLLGVTGQSVYAWEQERSRPRRKQLEAIAEVRAMGKREAISRLEELG